MIIRTLDLENFGAIRKANLEFQRGFNLIVGANGQGKSHIFRAIAYLLLNDVQKTIGDYINWNSDFFKVNLKVEHLNKLFEIGAFYDGSSSKELLMGNDTYNNRAATEVLSEYFDPSLCKASIVSFQGEIDLVDTTSAKRRDCLKRIYDLDFSRDIDDLREESKGLEISLKELEKQIYFYDNKIYPFKELLPLPCSEDNYLRNLSELESVRNKVLLIEQEIKQFRELTESLRSLEDDEREKKEEIIELEKKVTVTKNKITTLKDELQEDFEVHLHELQKELDKDFNAEKRKIIEDLSLIILDRVPTFDDAELKEFQDKRDNATFVFKESKNILERCERGECPTCGKDFDSSDVSFHKDKMERARIDLENIEKKIQLLEDEKERIDDERRKLNELMSKKSLLETKLENEVERIKTEKKTIVDKITVEEFNIRQKKKNIQLQIDNETVRIEDYEKLSGKLFSDQMKIESKILIIQQKLPEKMPKVDNYNFEKIKKLEVAIADYEDTVKTNDLYTRENEKITQEKENDNRVKKDLKKKKTGITEEIRDLDRGSTILRKEFPNYVISEIVGRIESGMNNFLDETYDGRYHTQIKETKSGLDILYGPKKKNIMLAGGAEMNLFNLGLKNAFCELAGLKVLHLDEIDSYMDSEISERVFTVLNRMIQEEKLDQVFLITHNNDIKDLVINDFGARCFSVDGGKAECI